MLLIVYNALHTDACVTSKDFRLAVATGMVQGFSRRERAVPKVRILGSLRHNNSEVSGQHFPGLKK